MNAPDVVASQERQMFAMSPLTTRTLFPSFGILKALAEIADDVAKSPGVVENCAVPIFTPSVVHRVTVLFIKSSGVFEPVPESCKATWRKSMSSFEAVNLILANSILVIPADTTLKVGLFESNAAANDPPEEAVIACPLDSGNGL